MDNELNGFVEIWGEVRLCHLEANSSDDFRIRISGEPYTFIRTFEEFVDQVHERLYLSLEDYRKGNSIDLFEWWYGA
jgi:hypothetical protein